MKKINALSILSGFSVTELFAKKNIISIIVLNSILVFFLLLSGCQKNINENFEKISYLEFQEKIQKNEEFYIIFERDDCPACPVFLEKFNQVSGENNLSFFVIDTNELNSKQKYECKDKFNLEYVPTAIFIKSGEMENRLTGTDDIKEIRKFQKNKWYLYLVCFIFFDKKGLLKWMKKL